MALKLGWTVDDYRESYWKHDPSVDLEATPAEDLAAYEKDGDGSHLRVKNGGAEPPTRIRFRALTADERASVMSLAIDSEGQDWGRMLMLAFRVGCDLPDGGELAKKERVRGLNMLPAKLVSYLIREHGDALWMFYGGLVWSASNLTSDEKKASPSDATPKRSSP